MTNAVMLSENASLARTETSLTIRWASFRLRISRDPSRSTRDCSLRAGSTCAGVTGSNGCNVTLPLRMTT